MFNYWSCCRFCLQVTNQKMNCLNSKGLLKNTEEILGFKISNTDRCSTYICSNCFFEFGKMSSFRNNVLNNQKTIQEWLDSEEQSAQTIKIQDGSDDDDIKVEIDNPEINNLSSLDTSKRSDNGNNKTRKRKLKVVLNPCNTDDISRINISQEVGNTLLNSTKNSNTNVEPINKSITINEDPDIQEIQEHNINGVEKGSVVAEKSSTQENKSETVAASRRDKKRRLNIENAPASKQTKQSKIITRSKQKLGEIQKNDHNLEKTTSFNMEKQNDSNTQENTTWKNIKVYSKKKKETVEIPQAIEAEETKNFPVSTLDTIKQVCSTDQQFNSIEETSKNTSVSKTPTENIASPANVITNYSGAHQSSIVEKIGKVISVPKIPTKVIYAPFKIKTNCSGAQQSNYVKKIAKINSVPKTPTGTISAPVKIKINYSGMQLPIQEKKTGKAISLPKTPTKNISAPLKIKTNYFGVQQSSNVEESGKNTPVFKTPTEKSCVQNVVPSGKVVKIRTVRGKHLSNTANLTKADKKATRSIGIIKLDEKATINRTTFLENRKSGILYLNPNEKQVTTAHALDALSSNTENNTPFKIPAVSNLTSNVTNNPNLVDSIPAPVINSNSVNNGPLTNSHLQVKSNECVVNPKVTTTYKYLPPKNIVVTTKPNTNNVQNVGLYNTLCLNKQISISTNRKSSSTSINQSSGQYPPATVSKTTSSLQTLSQSSSSAPSLQTFSPSSSSSSSFSPRMKVLTVDKRHSSTQKNVVRVVMEHRNGEKQITCMDASKNLIDFTSLSPLQQEQIQKFYRSQEARLITHSRNICYIQPT